MNILQVSNMNKKQKYYKNNKVHFPKKCMFKYCFLYSIVRFLSLGLERNVLRHTLCQSWVSVQL